MGRSARRCRCPAGRPAAGGACGRHGRPALRMDGTAHLEALMRKREGQLGGEGALPDAALAREDQNDVLDALQALGRDRHGCQDRESMSAAGTGQRARRTGIGLAGGAGGAELLVRASGARAAAPRIVRGGPRAALEGEGRSSRVPNPRSVPRTGVGVLWDVRPTRHSHYPATTRSDMRSRAGGSNMQIEFSSPPQRRRRFPYKTIAAAIGLFATGTVR